jgi:exonuclease III
MKIATFNINGIKARLPALLDWLDEAQPDVALLQEIKSVDEAFPREPFEERGYNLETHGQKSFNGVAILSKLPLEDVTCPTATPRRGPNTTTSWPGWTGWRPARANCSPPRNRR